MITCRNSLTRSVEELQVRVLLPAEKDKKDKRYINKGDIEDVIIRRMEFRRNEEL